MSNPSTSRLQQFTSTLAQTLASPPPHHDQKYYEPRHQPWYTYHNGSWQPREQPSKFFKATNSTSTSHLTLITWNIDMLASFTGARMKAALSHLSTTILPSIPSTHAAIICLQENDADDITLIKTTPWVQERFILTDVDESRWLTPLYGTTILIDRRLGSSVQDAFRVSVVSRFDRDLLFVDIALHAQSESSDALGSAERAVKLENRSGSKVLRLCNVHFESLVADPPLRPGQIAAAAKYMHSQEVGAALLAGDTNAIQPFDQSLHSDNGLNDAYLSLGGRESEVKGMTWGYQALIGREEKFPPCRMDKVMMADAVEARSLERVGVGEEVKHEEDRKDMERNDMNLFISDHYGLRGEFEVMGLEMRLDSEETSTPRI